MAIGATSPALNRYSARRKWLMPNDRADYVVFDKQSSPKGSNYEKFQISGLLERYERVLWLDGDAMVADSALTCSPWSPPTGSACLMSTPVIKPGT